MKNNNQLSEQVLSEQVLNDIAIYMNDNIREELHFRLAPCEPDLFLREYVKRNPAFAELLKTEFGIEVESK